MGRNPIAAGNTAMACRRPSCRRMVSTMSRMTPATAICVESQITRKITAIK